MCADSLNSTTNETYFCEWNIGFWTEQVQILIHTSQSLNHHLIAKTFVLSKCLSHFNLEIPKIENIYPVSIRWWKV